ncbi:hypothetical protein [Microvirga arabica]|uniref:hypothetical protein n=1 Tax=Microvirga arabica TaxID=1128671 RepID=UPI001939BCE2|nr:hypothetical protein [Microvirga arabica]MBM1169915.1 hypothetical protein [Microvirga arabica]
MARSKTRKQMLQGKPSLQTQPKPIEQEKAAVATARQSDGRRSRPARIAILPSDNGLPSIAPAHGDIGAWLDQLKEMFGSGSSEFALEQLQMLTKFTNGGWSTEREEAAVNAMLATVAGAQPQNEMEGVLAVQIAASHQLAMTLLARVGHAEHIPVLESNGNMALKLLKISREHAEALAKLQRGGNQTVRVEHVHVHSGGQAIVGNVTQPGGRGPDTNSDDQPHAPGAENGKT